MNAQTPAVRAPEFSRRHLTYALALLLGVGAFNIIDRTVVNLLLVPIGKDLHLLLVTRVAGKTPEQLSKLAGTAPLLIVGETDAFAEHGGMVGFVREEDAIRLTLNLERTTKAGLKVSAKLSSVARLVKTQSSAQ